MMHVDNSKEIFYTKIRESYVKERGESERRILNGVAR